MWLVSDTAIETVHVSAILRFRVPECHISELAYHLSSTQIQTGLATFHTKQSEHHHRGIRFDFTLKLAISFGQRQ